MRIVHGKYRNQRNFSCLHQLLICSTVFCTNNCWVRNPPQKKLARRFSSLWPTFCLPVCCVLHDDITALVVERIKCIYIKRTSCCFAEPSRAFRRQITGVLLCMNGAILGPALSCYCKVIRPQRTQILSSWIKRSCSFCGYLDADLTLFSLKKSRENILAEKKRGRHQV